MNLSKYTYLFFAITFLLSLKYPIYANAMRDTVEMKKVEAGEFLMGSKKEEGRADERPQRNIYLDTYKIDSYEVSNKRYLKFIRDTGRKDPANPYSAGLLSDETGIDNLPVVQVTWYDAVDYCRWAGKHLPTEAQWEKASSLSSSRAPSSMIAF